MSLADQTADGLLNRVQGDASESKNGTIDGKGMRWEEDDDAFNVQCLDVRLGEDGGPGNPGTLGTLGKSTQALRTVIGRQLVICSGQTVGLGALRTTQRGRRGSNAMERVKDRLILEILTGPCRLAPSSLHAASTALLSATGTSTIQEPTSVVFWASVLPRQPSPVYVGPK
ncbi:hypothetical protein E4U13_006499 [Claviceps humidiphila]|uniref:Uncharacterized protein n=1 Tax=Claviceps humidiphila TaxID=1294629 RepID=A0A9P7PVS0_9HYPO|nr:hypothetical protein E4U13_006499 [Claviceps humidiphila]